MPDTPVPTVSIPWYAKLASKLFRGRISKLVSGALGNKPGLLRTLLALAVVAIAFLPAAGQAHIATIISAVIEYLGLAAQTAGVPVDPKALAEGFRVWWLQTLALLALLRPVLRWVVVAWVAARKGPVA